MKDPNRILSIVLGAIFAVVFAAVGALFFWGPPGSGGSRLIILGFAAAGWAIGAGVAQFVRLSKRR